MGAGRAVEEGEAVVAEVLMAEGGGGWRGQGRGASQKPMREAAEVTEATEAAPHASQSGSTACRRDASWDANQGAAGGMARWGGEGAEAEAGGATGEAEGEVVDVEAEASQDEQERARDELLRALDDALFTGEVLFSRVAGAAANHAAEGLHDYPDLDKPWRGLGCFDDERREADRRAEEIEARLLKSLADALERKQQPAKKG